MTNLIKVLNGVAERAPLPEFLEGLEPESLADLSWTDPSLGVQDCAWWPTVDATPALGESQAYGAETLHPDVAKQVVIITREVYAVAPVLPPEAQYVEFVQQMLDAKAQAHGYDGILSACSYATDANPRFRAEGLACVAWRSAVWTKAGELLGQVKAGTLPQPMPGALLAMLPTMEWPNA